MINNKKGIELSVNFIVTLIIAVVVFGLGVKYTYDMFSGAKDIQGISQEQLDAQIESLYCSGGQRVCLSTSSTEIKKGDGYVFGVNIRNDLKRESDFYLTVSLTKAFNTENYEMPITGNELFILPETFPQRYTVHIEPNDNIRTGVYVKPRDTIQKGRYVIDVVVEADGVEDYEPVHKIYVTVP